MDHFDIPLLVRKSDGGYGYDRCVCACVRVREVCVRVRAYFLFYLFVTTLAAWVDL